MTYKVVYTQNALNDLRSIHRYIKIDLLAPDAARNVSDKIMSEIEKLDEIPDRFALYEKAPWKERGLRKMNVGNFLVFYLPIEKQKQVLIVAIMYCRRNIDKILDDND
ncbi:MAG: type II toxin-antitoxin system RelE/ParE family toxin [Clostridiales bacterium]|nr:type II toxin-antitoxin system RelE/ParE family toxin [Clostridiales bacterium]